MVICTWHNRALRGRSASHHFDKIDFPTLIKLIFPSVTKLTLKWMLNCTWHIRALHGVLTSYYFDKICFSISIKLISPLWQNWFAIKCWTAPGIFGHFMVDWHLITLTKLISQLWENILTVTKFISKLVLICTWHIRALHGRLASLHFAFQPKSWTALASLLQLH